MSLSNTVRGTIRCQCHTQSGVQPIVIVQHKTWCFKISSSNTTQGAGKRKMSMSYTFRSTVKCHCPRQLGVLAVNCHYSRQRRFFFFFSVKCHCFTMLGVHAVTCHYPKQSRIRPTVKGHCLRQRGVHWVECHHLTLPSKMSLPNTA